MEFGIFDLVFNDYAAMIKHILFNAFIFHVAHYPAIVVLHAYLIVTPGNFVRPYRYRFYGSLGFCSFFGCRTFQYRMNFFFLYF